MRTLWVGGQHELWTSLNIRIVCFVVSTGNGSISPITQITVKCLLQPQLQLVMHIVSVAAAGNKTLSRFSINCVLKLGSILFLRRNCSLKVSLKWIQSNSKSRKTFNDNFEDPWLSDSLKRTNVWVELKGMFFPNWAFYLPPLTN